MKVNGKHYESIWLDEDDPKMVKIIDQQKLPFEFVIKELKTLEDAYNAIKKMEVRGAPLIGVTGAFGLYLALLGADRNTWKNDFDKAYKHLASSRPTAVNLFWALDRVKNSVYTANAYSNAVELCLNTSLDILDDERESCRMIGEHGVRLIEDIYKKVHRPVNILTHCNAGWLACIEYGTATAPMYTAHDKGIPIHVWVDETRPRNQGARLTAWELGQHGVAHTLIVDNAGGHLMQHGLVDLVLVGSDRTTSSGDVANKIGTYLKALAARDNDIPFYVALPESSFDMEMKDGVKEIPVETRGEEELTIMEGVDVEGGELRKIRIAPQGTKAVNYGFDVTPARLVTGFITEKGVSDRVKK